MKYYLGLDIGSVAVKVVLVDSAKPTELVLSYYRRSHGQPFKMVYAVLKEVFKQYKSEDMEFIAVTGTGGKTFSVLTGAHFINEISAQATATGTLYPNVKSIIEIGGEDSKFIRINKTRIIDFATNSICAAGTGSFLDQQASRLGVAIENFGDEALKSQRPPSIAGRCSVFAKTDMIHLQQVGTPLHDIMAGLCHAMARNFKSNIVKSVRMDKPISLQGGVAANKGIVKAFTDVLDLSEGDLVIPRNFALMGSIGAVLVAVTYKAKTDATQVQSKLEQYIKDGKLDVKKLPPLKGDDYVINVQANTYYKAAGQKIDAYVGVDVGSISTNVVVIDKNKSVLARRYIMTAGKPIEAVRQGLWEVGQEIADYVVIKGAGSTGSGRYLTGEFFGADVIKNEITSHARGASSTDINVDTIIEIGGQDSKYIRLNKGVIIDFTMNKVCAAGTGSFLEEQSEKLGVKIDQEFGNNALSAKQPCALGERCTVFMESQLNYYKQQGVAKDNLIGGLSYSIVENYLNKVVENRKIGNHIFFQGGVAFNRGVKAAYEAVLGKKVIVPPHHDILGAVGVAILAIEETKSATKFKGFDLRNRKYKATSFECVDCANNCEIHQVAFESVSGEAGKTLAYGSRCGKFDDAETKKKRASLKIPQLFKERERMFLSIGKPDTEAKGNIKVGIPRVSVFFDLYPFWSSFFRTLGCEVILSSETSRSIIKKGTENVLAEPCFPIKTAHGHILDLLEKGKVDYVFLPMQINMAPLNSDFERSYNCPYVQGLPYTSASSIDYAKYKAKLLRPVFHMDRGSDEIAKTLKKMALKIGIKNKTLISKAVETAFETQKKFHQWQDQRGKEILDGLKPNEKALVILTRSYNAYDPGLNLGLPEKIRQLGMQAIPIDFLPLANLGKEIGADYPYMYWRSGQKILAAARLVARDPRLFGVYLTNFSCGPDSYVLKFFDKEMAGKPYLILEIDEHTADVGMLTRCEAFLDTIRGASNMAQPEPVSATPFLSSFAEQNGRTIYIPYMDDHGFIIAAAMRACGVKAQGLPASDDESLTIGRKYTTGKECYPSIITTGDIIKKTRAADFQPGKSAFFMPSANGPCRFGQYNKLHRMVLDEIGLNDVPLVLFDQTSNYHNDMAAIGSTKFKKAVWQGMILVDLLQKIARETRPYEINKGETNKIYQESLDKVVNSIEKWQSIETLAKELADRFSAIKVDRSRPKPKIGVIGEIYVRSNPFTNNYVIKQLESYGAEVTLPPFEEWLDYIDYLRHDDYKREGEFVNLIRQKLTQFFQERYANNIRKHFSGRIKNFYLESSTDEVIEYGRPYINPALLGEAILSMGRAVEYVHAGYNGILNVIPFGCMPGTVVDALLKQFKSNHDNIPVLTLTVDGSKHPGEEMRLDAFVAQTRENMK
ncbi:MAG: acyl-CoA dehydratase activase [Candidatus Brocadiia bacterium]